MVAFCNMASGAEGLMLGAAAGIDPDVLNQVIRNSSGNGFGFRSVAHKALRGDWSPTFALDLAYKTCTSPSSSRTRSAFRCRSRPRPTTSCGWPRGSGYGGDDTTAMMRVYEDTLKREVRGKPRDD